MSDLSELIDIRDNRATLRFLEEQVRSTLGVIPFVGAGLSSPYGFPLWTNFLLDQASLAGISAAVEDRIKNGQFEEAAEDLIKKREARRFEDAIDSAFSDPGLEGRVIGGAVGQIPRLASGPVITTNFDPLLEYVFERAGNPFDMIVLGKRVDDSIKALQQNRRLLIKLHGNHAFAQDRVLTLTDYTSAYGDPEPTKVDLKQPLPSLLRLVLQSRPILFLGCSLSKDRTLVVLRRVVQDYPDIAHYALIALPGENRDIPERDQFLSACGIRPIWYPSGRHEFVESVLGHLVSLGNPTVGSSTPKMSIHQNPDDLKQLTLALQSELESAGYPANQTSLIRVVEPPRKTAHGRIFVATQLADKVVVKLTKKEMCSLPTLQRIQGKELELREQGVKTTAATPNWVGQSSQSAVEVLNFFGGITLEQMILRSHFLVHGDLLAQIFNSLVKIVHRYHLLGVLHRDVTPANVLVQISDGDIHLALIDCSFACGIDDKAQFAVEAKNFTAPEQAAGHASELSDFYSVAATCYYLANSMPPPTGSNSELKKGLRKMDVGAYYKAHDFPFLTYDEAGGGGSPTAVFRFLLDPEGRSVDWWRLLLRTSSRAVFEEPITGILDLGESGFILLREPSYQAIPRTMIADMADAEIRSGRLQSVEVCSYLKSIS